MKKLDRPFGLPLVGLPSCASLANRGLKKHNFCEKADNDSFFIPFLYNMLSLSYTTLPH